jgi:hypothetical protein
VSCMHRQRSSEGRQSGPYGRNSGSVHRQIQNIFQSEWFRSVSVEVGIMMAHNPLHGSTRAAFPHPSLASVLHRRASLDFPMRPRATTALGRPRISRFPREVSRYVHGGSDRAGLWYTWRYRCTRWSLPLSRTTSASRSDFLTRLNTRPAASLSRLRSCSCEQLGMTWGRYGSPIHYCRMPFRFTTSRRFNRRTGEIKWQPARQPGRKATWSINKDNLR